VRNSLFALTGIYTPLGNGEYRFIGARPGADWHGHGYFPKSLTVLVGGAPAVIRLYKHRWKHTTTIKTVHDRPPEDPVLVRFCTLILFLRVWAVVSSPSGFHNRREVFEGLESGCGCDRTVQRWTALALEDALEIQQAIRLAIIEEVEPRPVERLFDGGLSPPHVVTQRRWKSSTKHQLLYRGYAMLWVASQKLATHASNLLAGARRRWPTSEKTFGI
jgi:hypothetical protein